MKKQLITSAALAAFAWAFPTVALATTIGFIDDQPLPVQGTGSLKGAVQLAQSHFIFPRANEARNLPRLVQDRAALLMYLPDKTDGEIQALRLKATLGTQTLGELNLQPPAQFPKSDQPPSTGTRIEYSTRAWSVALPWAWLKPGLQLRISSDSGREQAVAALEFSAPSDLVLQHIRIGMLSAAPKATFLETNTAEAAIDYFQKIPVSRLIVSQYEPVEFDRIVLANGKVYNTASADQGDVHSGDMREQIGKSLVSVGINLANYGIHSSAGTSQWQPGYFAQVVVHHSQGRYRNGLVTHGLSGGNGMLTLADTKGNEFSHELGHVFGLGHYPNGYAGSVHGKESGWGYDAHKHRVIGNLAWDRDSLKYVDGTVVPKFADHPYGLDAMAGGWAMGSVSKYTHHTGYSASFIQRSLAGFAVPDSSSISGYRKWNASTQTMNVLLDVTRKKPASMGVPVVTLVGYYDPQGVLPTTIYPALFGSHGVTYPSEPLLLVPMPRDCRLVVTGSGQQSFVARLDGKRLASTEMNKFHVNVPMSLAATAARVECAQSGRWATLASASIRTSNGFSPKVTEVGRAAGFGAMADSSTKLSDVLPRAQLPLASLDELRAAVGNALGPVRNWVGNDASATKGQLHEYLNTTNGQYDYFLLRKNGAYGYYPTNQASNQEWRYIGSASAFVNSSPNPLKLREQGQSTADAAMLKYYGKNTLKVWEGNGRNAGTVGDLYVYDNPSSRAREYFRLKTPSYGHFPTDKSSNVYWDYLGDEPTIRQSLAGGSDAAAFDRLVLAWYRKDRLERWGVPSRAGTPGNIYAYDNPYSRKRQYFRLKTDWYWYFPTDRSSNGDWEYLGQY